MILEFSVENFKSIKDKATLSFEATSDTTDDENHVITIGKTRILRMAAIYGSNASGKTNLLMALSFLRTLIKSSATTIKPNEPNGFTPFIFDKEKINTPGTFNIIFFINNIKYEYQISLTSMLIIHEELHYSPKGQRKKIYERQFNDQSKSFTYSWGSEIKIDEKIAEKVRKNIPFISAIVQLMDHEELSEVYQWFNNALAPLILPNGQNLTSFTMNYLETLPQNKARIIKILSSSDFGNIVDLEIAKNEIPEEMINSLDKETREQYKDKSGKYMMRRVYLKHAYGNNTLQLALDHESKGTIRYFELAGPLSLNELYQGLLSIDELDSSLHPELQDNFIYNFLKTENSQSQLLFTTHNVQLMDSGLLRRDEIWFAEKNNNTGGSEYYSLSDIKGTRKEGSFRKQYLAGKYGALPVLKNFQEKD